MSSSVLSPNPPLYVGDEELIGIPQELQSSTLPSMVPARLSHQAISTMNGNVIQIQNSGTRIDFVIPTGLGSGCIKAKTPYISMGITTDASGGALTSFTNPIAGVSSLINRIEIRAGSTLIDSILDADRLSNYLQTNFGNPQWNQTDQQWALGGNVNNCAPIVGPGGITSGNMLSSLNSGANTIVNGISKLSGNVLYVNIPILSGLFNNQKAFPMYLLESALTVSIYMNDYTSAFFQGALGTQTNSYAVNNATLNFSRVHIDEEIAQQVKQSMREQGQLFSMDYIGYSNYRASMPQGGGLTYVMSPNLKSLLGVVALPFDTLNDASANQVHAPQLPFGPANPNFNIQLFLDEMRLVQYNVDSLEKIALENRRLCRIAGNPHVVPVWLDNSQGASPYVGKIPINLVGSNTIVSPSVVQYNFAIGFNSCKFFDADIGYAGREVKNVRMQIDGQAQSDYTMFFILIHSACLSIDGAGNCLVSK